MASMEDGQHIFLGIGDWKRNQGLAKSFLVCGIFQWIFQKKKPQKAGIFRSNLESKLGNSQNAALDDPLKDSTAGFEVSTAFAALQQGVGQSWVSKLDIDDIGYFQNLSDPQNEQSIRRSQAPPDFDLHLMSRPWMDRFLVRKRAADATGPSTKPQWQSVTPFGAFWGARSFEGDEIWDGSWWIQKKAHLTSTCTVQAAVLSMAPRSLRCCLRFWGIGTSNSWLLWSFSMFFLPSKWHLQIFRISWSPAL